MERMHPIINALRHLGGSLLLIFPILAVSACGDVSSPDVHAMLTEEQDFVSPIFVSANLSGSNFSGRIENQNRDARIVAALVDLQALQVAPEAGGSPYWRILLQQGTSTNNQIRIPIAKRVFVNSHSEEKWSADSIQYFATTIRYELEAYSGFGSLEFRESSARVVFFRDPAIGEWRIQTINFASDDAAEIQNLVEQIGSHRVDDLRSSIRRAQSDAYDQIEAQILQAHGIARGPHSNTVTSDNGRLLWSSVPLAANGQMWRNLGQYCQENRGSDRAWRAPRYVDWVTLFPSNLPQYYQGRIIDTPDGRIFGGSLHRRATYYLSDLYTYEGDIVSGEPENPNALHAIGSISISSNGFMSANRRLERNPLNYRITSGGTNRSFVLCVVEDNESAAAPDLAPILAEARACTRTGGDAPFDVPERSSDQNTGEYNAAVSAAFLEANAANECVFTLPSGLQFRIDQAVDDAPSLARPGERVQVHYEGKLIDGTVFDSSFARGAPAVFPSDRLIAGWVEALPLMNLGEEWTLFIPANLAYGTDGTRGGPIGPNQALVFRLALLGLPDQGVSAETP